jgi:hypothetical protein
MAITALVLMKIICTAESLFYCAMWSWFDTPPPSLASPVQSISPPKEEEYKP